MLKTATNRLATVKELLRFFWEQKLWWMIPFVVMLLIIGSLILLTQAAPITPFLYTLF